MLEDIKTVKRITSSMIRYLESDGEYELVELLKHSRPSSEEIAYDNWNGGTYTYSFIYEIEIDEYRAKRAVISEYEKSLYEVASIFIPEYSCDQLGKVTIRPICRQYIDWNQGFSKDDLLREIETEKSMLISVATGGARIQEVNDSYKEKRSRLHEKLEKAGLDDPNQFNDLWEWYGRWSQGDLPSYASRRSFVSELYKETIDIIEKSVSTMLSENYEPTGWERVDRTVYEMKHRLSIANTEEQFQAIGMLGREALITIAQQVYNKDIHPTDDGVVPSDTDSKRMLDAFLNYSLSGSSNERQRKFAKASVDLANQLTHDRMADRSDAELCLTSVTAVANTIRIISNRGSLTRDKDKNGTNRVIDNGPGDCEVKKLIGGLAKWKRL